jgi:hypothetical protein
MKGRWGQMRQTTTAKVRLESRPTAVNPRKLGFIIYLEDMKRLGSRSFIWRIEAGLPTL